MKGVYFLNDSIIAYRGIYNNITIYENTIESIMYAVKNGLSVYIDVLLTKDNELIVFSDLDGTRLLKLKDSISSLKKEDIDYISSYNVPSLKEVINCIDSKVPIIININVDNKTIRRVFLDTLKDYNGKYVIQSNDYNALKYYKSNKLYTALMVSEDNKSYLNKDLDVDILSIEYNLVSEDKLKFLKEKYYLIGYLINNREDAKKYIKLYDNLIIDNIEEVFR